ncbi:MAG: hypothetical protein Q9167_004006, partial [Letrouitia subvulpina]
MSKEDRDLSPTESPPPSYESAVTNGQNDDLTAAFSSLKLGAQTVKPSQDQCLAHLKLLEAFHSLREEIACTDGLFDIHDSISQSAFPETSQRKERAELLLQIREKRWAIYVTKATQRYQIWWQKVVEPHSKMVKHEDLLSAAKKLSFETSFYPLPADELPPLDVVMVWHAHMLNPRDFLEDCMRYGKFSLWTAGLPWPAINSCIHNETFEYQCSGAAVKRFESDTGLKWDNLNDMRSLKIECAKCYVRFETPWTTCTSVDKWRENGPRESGQGFADRLFRVNCPYCKTSINHEFLRAQKFNQNLKNLMEDDLPMPGTLLDLDGKMMTSHRGQHLFPNWLLKAGLYKEMQVLLDPSRVPSWTIEDVRKSVESALADRNILKAARGFAIKPRKAEKVSIRRMMSRYWANSSIFALDLVGAVIRQGSFIEKMHAIDWIHSPTAASTMGRLINKYERFFEIMERNPGQLAVPTLDVDLAWHTHQLTPSSYYAYSLSKTSIFISHDDKIPDFSLSTAFERTSKLYQSLFHEIYSECTCWYCESIRESHTSTASRLLKPSTSRAMENSLRAIGGSSSTHPDGDDDDDEKKRVHISAHSAIQPRDESSRIKARAQAVKLDQAYRKAVKHAKRNKRPIPQRQEANKGGGYAES